MGRHLLSAFDEVGERLTIRMVTAFRVSLSQLPADPRKLIESPSAVSVEVRRMRPNLHPNSQMKMRYR